MAKRKHFYYVAVIGNDNVFSFVYQVNNNEKRALWSLDRKPLAMPKSVAEDLAEGLMFNFIPAVVVQSFIELQGTGSEPDAETTTNQE